jgi:hypothetical protein
MPAEDTEKKEARPLGDLSAADLRASTDEFSALIAEELPRIFDLAETWPAVAHAFLARAGDLLDSLTRMVEAEKEADAQALLRVFFELVTLFCWLAIAPKEHVARWQEWSFSRELKLHNDAKQFGIDVLTEAELAEIGKPEKPLAVPAMAQEVDDYWPAQSSAFRPHPNNGPRHILTFRGAYTALYRKGSTIIHTDLYAVDRYLSTPLMSLVNVHPKEHHSPSPDYPGFAIPLMGFLLLAFAHHFKWPNEQKVREITEGLLYRSDGSRKD